MKLKIKKMNSAEEIKSIKDINDLIAKGIKFKIVDNYSEHVQDPTVM